MSAELRHFAPNDLLYTQDESWKILRYFFPQWTTPAIQFTDKDRSFAQAILLEAVDASYAMGYVHILAKLGLYKVIVTPDDLKKLIKDLAKQAMKHWFNHATGKDLENPKIYDSVLSQIRRAWRSEVQLRQETGGYTEF